jgi:hypothetical protein
MRSADQWKTDEHINQHLQHVLNYPKVLQPLFSESKSTNGKVFKICVTLLLSKFNYYLYKCTVDV